MTLPSVPPVPASEVVDQLRADLHAQPWFKRFSNTVTTAFGGLTLVIWLLASNGYELSGTIQTAIGSVVVLATVLGVLQTPNGITPKGVEKVERAAEEVNAKF
ncbi:membrane protein [Gordonia phage Bonum]|uniref:Membrane protein n=1 Tax=Gordonia phage Kabluna TaxID=2041511 RepID=A0A2D1GD16_9CAUD|nr:holin [Gordonia phage Kabluna]ATN89574.1 membrane protein [Gordonia phage Kabluna]QXN73358.1 membrane protein [Gordonia phage Bonum]